jgi:hypothetical protein
MFLQIFYCGHSYLTETDVPGGKCMASNPLFIIPDFFCIFPMNFAMAKGLKEMGKFFWEGRDSMVDFKAKSAEPLV